MRVLALATGVALAVGMVGFVPANANSAQQQVSTRKGVLKHVERTKQTRTVAKQHVAKTDREALADKADAAMRPATKEALAAIGALAPGKKAAAKLTAQPRAAAAATSVFTVDSEADFGLLNTALPGTCVDDEDGKCTLRAAIEAANLNEGVTTEIHLPAGEYKIDNGLVGIWNSMKIIGDDPANTIINGGDNIENGIFNINGLFGPIGPVGTSVDKANAKVAKPKVVVSVPPAVDFVGVTIENGSQFLGGAVLIGDAAVTMTNVVLRGNAAEVGGAVFNFWGGSLWMYDSVVKNNFGGIGAGIFNLGSIYLQNTVVGGSGEETANVAGLAGGGIANLGNAVLQDAKVDGNFLEPYGIWGFVSYIFFDAAVMGGGIYNLGVLNATGGSISGNEISTPSDEGGGVGAGLANMDFYFRFGPYRIDIDGLATLDNVDVADNLISGEGWGEGGGIYSENQLALTNVDITGNAIESECTWCWLDGAGLVNDHSASFIGGTVSGNQLRHTDRMYTDGKTTDGDNTLLSSAPGFNPGDIGLMVTGAGIPAGTTITGLVSDGPVIGVTLSNDATATATDVAFVIVDRWGSFMFGGGVVNWDPITIDGVTISNNSVDTGGGENDALGGGIYDFSENLLVKNSTIQGNTLAASDDALGGGVFTDHDQFGPFTFDSHGSLSNVTVDDNTATAPDYVDGAGISAYGFLNLSEVEVTNNTADGGNEVDGGAVRLDRRAELDKVTVADNTTTAGNFIYGGALLLDDQAAVNNSKVTGNKATVIADQAELVKLGLWFCGGYIGGGAVYADNLLSLVDTTISGNTVDAGYAEVYGGALYTDDLVNVNRTAVVDNTLTNPTYAAGTAWFSNGMATVRQSTVGRNTATTDETWTELSGTTLFNYLTTVVNSTFSGNTLKATGDGSGAIGGGLLVDDDVSLLNVTIGDNTVLGTPSTVATAETRVKNTKAREARKFAARVGRPKVDIVVPTGNEVGSGIFIGEALVNIQNSIIGQNQPADLDCFWFAGPVRSAGGNLDSGETCGFTNLGDQVNTDPLLEPLADNGGPTPTQKLGAISPARDNAKDTACPTVDQRGVGRILGLGCDVGAFEAAPLEGYYTTSSEGGVFAFGPDAHFKGNALNEALAAPIVGIAASPTGNGYWLAGEDGGVFAYGDAGFFGNALNEPLAGRIVGIQPTPDGKGYFLIAEDGGVFAYGSAVFSGSLGGMALNGPISAMAVDADGDGYNLSALDGGVFGIAAPFLGSLVGQGAAPVMGIASDKVGGYWLAGLDGNVSRFGTAPDLGNALNLNLEGPILGVSSNRLGTGYFLAGLDGGVFAFGAQFHGSMHGQPLNAPVVGISAV
ncbi:MAG TPA: choice-of-anchor Q domain-containing protein [Acidimicrobiales bacterium]|jgi:hypothetical protein|nr:choice-of-anchor Q domain-containing protein [Acidimicrobiales bacterium]